MIYLYYCAYCDLSFEASKPMTKASCAEDCPKCGVVSRRRYTPIPALFGWRLTEASHIRGNEDEYERDI